MRSRRSPSRSSNPGRRSRVWNRNADLTTLALPRRHATGGPPDPGHESSDWTLSASGPDERPAAGLISDPALAICMPGLRIVAGPRLCCGPRAGCLGSTDVFGPHPPAWRGWPVRALDAALVHVGLDHARAHHQVAIARDRPGDPVDV